MNSGGEQARKRAKKGTGTIKKTESGKYEYRIQYEDVYGMRHRKCFTCRSIEECLEKAREFQERIKQYKGDFNPDVTIPDILHWKVDIDHSKNYTAEAGYERNVYTISIIEKHPLGSIPIVSVTPAMVNDFLSSKTSYSNSMLSKIHSMIKTAFRIAFDSRLIEVNFMTRDDMRCPKSDRQDKKVRGLTEKEQALLVQTIMEHKVPENRNDYRLQLLIELYSGMRMGEINALRRRDIDFEAGFIHVRSTISIGFGSHVTIKNGTKTDAGVRDIPISDTLMPVLKMAVAKMRKNPAGLVFYDYQKKNMISTSQVDCFFRRMCKKAGIEVMGQHSLRHTFATRCIEAGISPLVLKTWLGHTDIHITLDTYSDVFSRMNAKSISLLDQHLETINAILLTDGSDEDR